MGAALFDDRQDAGRQLARRLTDLAGRDAVVLALPRGGVPVGLEIARQLGADLDLLVVQKLGAPGQPELAVGAVAADGTLAVNARIAYMLGIDVRELESEAASMAAKLAERASRLRSGRPPVPIQGRVTVVVDDGIATGASLRAALGLIRSRQPRQLVAAVPVAPPEACADLRSIADRVECPHRPVRFVAVGHWYRDFTQVTDAEVAQMLAAARRPVSQRPKRGRARGDSG